MVEDLKKATDKERVEKLYLQYGKKLYGFAVSQWKLKEDVAWELVYKTVYNIAEKYLQYEFENEKKLQGFIFKSFVNYLRNHYRDMKRRTFKRDNL